MFIDVMNLTMNAAIFRAGTPQGEPKRAAPAKARQIRQRSQFVARKAGESKMPAAVRIYADAFKTAVYGG